MAAERPVKETFKCIYHSVYQWTNENMWEFSGYLISTYICI
jgi:hypothetical protein